MLTVCTVYNFLNKITFHLSFLSDVEMDANLGGTEIFHPLETIFKKPSIEGYLRQVFVLTDGEVI